MKNIHTCTCKFYRILIFVTGVYTCITDAPIFISILTQTNIAQLNKIFSTYEKLYGHSIEALINRSFTKKMKIALQTIGE